MCQDCLLKEIGAGITECDKHGTNQIDWKCMLCCSPALFCCFGTHYFCNACHDEFNRTRRNPTLKDCKGINCPLGMAHPPPSLNPREGGVFPLGCGICRSEKLEILKKNRDVQQIVNEDNLPKFWNKWAQPKKNGIKIERPIIEIELPDFIAMADEILEAEHEALLEAERECIRILNRRPLVVLTQAQINKQKRKQQRKMLKAAAEGILPVWFLDPEGED